MSQSKRAKTIEVSNTDDDETPDSSFNVIFLGSGVSTAVPELGHVLAGQCKICKDALENPSSKNRRNNVSIALTFQDTTGIKRCVLIDCGKTMRDACMRHLPVNGVEKVDGIVLTHGHADAMLGLDDVRDLQKSETVRMESGEIGFRIVSGAMPMYMHQETMNVVSRTFSYLFQSAEYWPDTQLLKRRIALIDFCVVEPTAQLNIFGLPIRCFPVLHGGDYVCLAFNIGKPGELVYISDVKVIPPETWMYLESLGRIKLLVLDYLSPGGIFSHLGLNEAVEIVQRLKPERALFTGMSCGVGDHDNVCKQLAKDYPTLNISLAFDGLRIDGFAL
jgi:phosphoribosyl 1,2-cyclic phosphodiesterase